MQVLEGLRAAPLPAVCPHPAAVYATIWCYNLTIL